MMRQVCWCTQKEEAGGLRVRGHLGFQARLRYETLSQKRKDYSAAERSISITKK
jgi:hypothetical protein